MGHRQKLQWRSQKINSFSPVEVARSAFSGCTDRDGPGSTATLTFLAHTDPRHRIPGQEGFLEQGVRSGAAALLFWGGAPLKCAPSTKYPKVLNPPWHAQHNDWLQPTCPAATPAPRYSGCRQHRSGDSPGQAAAAAVPAGEWLRSQGSRPAMRGLFPGTGSLQVGKVQQLLSWALQAAFVMVFCTPCCNIAVIFSENWTKVSKCHSKRCTLC